jgi:transcription elongation factor S-II
MEAKEVELRGKAIIKAMNENEPSSSLIKLLNDLKTGVRATEDLLRQTKIGVTVNRLRTYKDPAVGKLAQECVTKWKNEVNNNKKRAGSARPAAAPANGATSSPAPVSATASPAPASAKKQHNVDPEKRNAQTDGIDLQITGLLARDNSIKLLYNGLAYMSSERTF